jgi:adenylate kinase
MIVILLGPPGCGKGTQSEFLMSVDGFQHISTGNLLRAEFDKKSDLGLKIKDILSTGCLINDDIVMELIKKNLDFNTIDRIILDGFPRTVAQASSFDDLLSVSAKKVDCVIDFEITHDLLYSRIKGRFACSECGAIYHKPDVMPKNEGVCDFCNGKEFKKRSDDNADALSKRLLEFEKMTAPLREYYKGKNILKVLDAAKSVEQIRLEIKSLLAL